MKETPVSNHKRRILVVDDEEQIVFILHRSLKKLGDDYEIVTARNGKYYVKITLVPDEALSSLKAEHFDMVIAALHESEQDNLGLIRQVRWLNPKTYTMLIADQVSPEAQEWAAQFAAACLTGPLNMTEFASNVQRILS